MTATILMVAIGLWSGTAGMWGSSADDAHRVDTPGLTTYSYDRLDILTTVLGLQPPAITAWFHCCVWDFGRVDALP
jgi:hypothetical protein